MNEKIYPSMVIRSQAEAIELLEKENQQLKDNWNELKKWLENTIEQYGGFAKCRFECVYNKMQELERNNGK